MFKLMGKVTFTIIRSKMYENNTMSIVYASLLYSFFQKMAFVRVLLLEVLCLALFISINAKAVDTESKASFVIPL